MTDLTVVILAYNEAKHIERCIKSAMEVAKEVVVIDSFSSDCTVDLASKLGARVVQREFINHAEQFNWALDNCDLKTEWVMRLDCDEYLTSQLAREINTNLPSLSKDVGGIQLKRRVYFMGKWIKHGDYYPIWLVRIFRRSQARSEMRWMDEHIKVERGTVHSFEHDFIDENFNNLTWWTTKHNNYSTKEAVDLLNSIYNFFEEDDVKDNLFGIQLERKRWLKKRYAKLPLFIRPFIYFVYRYVIKLGFLDGRRGFIWHFLQGFWYRFLVDAKIYDIYRLSNVKSKAGIKTVLKQHYGLDLKE